MSLRRIKFTTGCQTANPEDLPVACISVSSVQTNLRHVPTDPIFGPIIPSSCDGIPRLHLDSRATVRPQFERWRGMKESIKYLTICVLALSVGIADGAKKSKHATPKPTKPVPRLGDETPLTAVKAHPEKYGDCIICGVVKVSNASLLPDEHKEKDYYCLKFWEAGKNVGDPLQGDVVASMYRNPVATR